MQTEAVRYHTTFQTCLVSTGDTKLITSDVKVEIRPNFTSLINFADCLVFWKQTFDLHRLSINQL